MHEWWNDTRIFDTLPLSTAEYLAILSRLNAARSGHRGAEHRKHERVRYRRRDIKVLLRFPDGSQAAYAVKPHNLSTMGLSFLHGFYIHASTHCETALRNLAGRVVVVPGEAVRCRHVSGKTHEIGVEFTRAIDLREFVADKDLVAGDGTPQNAPPRFAGQLLYVDDSPDDQELVRFMLSEMGVELHTAPTLQEALARTADTPFDVVMTKMTLPDATGPELAKALRGQGCKAYIVAVVSHAGSKAGADAETEALAKGCDCILGTPLTASRLGDLLQGVLPGAGKQAEVGEPLLSTCWSDTKMRPLILKFVARLEGYVQHLGELLSTEQAAQFARVCRQMVDTAENYGYTPIAELVAQLGKAAEEGTKLEELKAELDELSRLCAAARRVSG